MECDRIMLGTIHNPELRKKLHLDDSKQASQIGWIKENIHKFPTRGVANVDIGPDPATGSLQQSDLLRKFYLAIAMNSLQYAYDTESKIFDQGDLPGPPPNVPIVRTGDNRDKHVIIVGAGVSGMVAAYELRKEGYSVEILEMSQRYGGRVKTLTQKDGYDQGLHTDCKLRILYSYVIQ